MYKYSFDNSSVVRLSDGAAIPFDPSNKDYVKYLEWSVLEGNTTEPADIAPVQPITLTRRQFFTCLHMHGYLTAEEAAASAVPADVMTFLDTLPPQQKAGVLITWGQLTLVPEDDALVNAVAASLGMDAAQTHDFFAQASGL